MNIIRDDIDWQQYEQETDHAAKVKPASAYLLAMMDDIGRPEAVQRQAYLPWSKTHRNFQLRGGETTCWAAANGSGKSEITGMLATSLAVQGEASCIASMEMKPRVSLHRQVKQFMGCSDANMPHDVLRNHMDEFRILADQRLWFYDHQGTVTPSRIIAVTRYVFKELGLKHMFVDSLMKCIRGEDDYNAQKDLVDELTCLARDYDAHVHLIHHLKKLEKETDLPDKNHVKGSGSIVDQVDNLMLVWRNKRKEDDKAAGKQINPEDPDTLVICRKQRNGTGWEGAIKLYHDPESKQYTSFPNGAMELASWPHREHQRRWA